MTQGYRCRPALFFALAYAIAWIPWAAGAYAGVAWIYYVGVLSVAVHLKWQLVDVDLDNPKDCSAKFRSNRFVGWILLAGIVLGRLWS